MVVEAVIFVVLSIFAVGLDLDASVVTTLDVSVFAYQALEHAARGMLVLDLLLFSLYLYSSNKAIVKEMFK